MAAPNKDIATATVLKYQEIIDTTVGRCRASFSDEGVDESVLDELRALWEAKLVATGVVGEPSNEGQQVIHQHQQLQQPASRVAQPAAGAAPMSFQQQQRQQQYYAMQAQYAPGVPGMPPAGTPGMYTPGGAQHFNMAAMVQLRMMQAQAHAAAAEQKRKLEASASGAPKAKMQRTIPQRDGPADDGNEAAADGEAAAAEEEEEEAEDDDPLTEDDEASGDEVDEAAVANVVLGQFEKVQRSKSKWKVVLKDCVLTLNGLDYLVRKLNGEMDF